MTPLEHLIAEASRLAGDDPCAAGHAWRMVGGRVCQLHGDGCSEPVMQCLRCGEFDYSHRDGECSIEGLGA